MTFFSNPKRKDYVLNPRGKALYDGKFIICCALLERSVHETEVINFVFPTYNIHFVKQIKLISILVSLCGVVYNFYLSSITIFCHLLQIRIVLAPKCWRKWDGQKAKV